MLTDLPTQERPLDLTPAVLAAGTTFLHQGSVCEGLALVLKGSARVYKLAESGRELTLYRVGAGESCILTASCILSDTPFPAFAVAETEMEVVVLPSLTVKRFLHLYESWREYIFRLLSQRMSLVLSVVEEVAFQRLDHRLALYLLQSPSDTLEKTHQEIASDLSSSREVVSRLLKDFERKDWLELSRGRILLRDRAALAQV